MNQTAQIISLDDAAELLGSGDGVWVGETLSVENPLIARLFERGESLKGLTVVGSSELRSDEIFNPRYSGTLRIVSIHNLRQSPGTGTAGKSSEKLCQSVCELFGLNTVALRMSAPDANGLCAVRQDAAELTGTICGYEGIEKRIAMLDLSFGANDEENVTRVPISDFDYICSYPGKDEQSSIA